jgi:hypothetical protein
MLKYAKGRFTYRERFEDMRNKRFHVLTAKIGGPPARTCGGTVCKPEFI